MASLPADIESLYEFGPELGRGEFSVVIIGTDKKTGEEVAIKVIDKNDMDTCRLESEITILKMVRFLSSLFLSFFSFLYISY